MEGGGALALFVIAIKLSRRSERLGKIAGRFVFAEISERSKGWGVERGVEEAAVRPAG